MLRVSVPVLTVLTALVGSSGCLYQHARPLKDPLPQSSDLIFNKPGEPPNPLGRYYYSSLAPGPRNTDKLFVALAFSGGGTRAAALSYGVLDALRQIPIECANPDDASTCSGKTLLDEVDVISSVSGGSFAAAYYALRRHDIFNREGDFQRRFLYADAQRELVGRAVYYPQSWLRILSRPEIAADLWSDWIFHGASYADLVKQPRPFIVLNASDYLSQYRFTFTQDRFDLLCADLNEFALSRAVAASSAFPGLLNSLTVNTFNGKGRCPVARPEPEWVADARKDPYGNRLSYRNALLYDKFTAENEKYLHLLDGGLVDNLGLRSIYEGLFGASGSSLPLMELGNLRAIENMLVIVVNARTGDKPARLFQPNAIPMGPLTLPVIGATSSLPMGTVSYDSVDMFTQLADEWNQFRQEILRQNEQKEAKGEKPEPPPMRIYSVELTFENILDKETRDYFKHLSTNFGLPRDTVDCLGAEAADLLRNASSYGGSTACLGCRVETFLDYLRDTLKGRFPPLGKKVVVTDEKCRVEKVSQP